MASPSNQNSFTSRRGKITTIIPDRSRAHSRRRLAKRETTLRAFTFVRDWEAKKSPVPLVHQRSTDKSDDITSPSRSSVTISPSPQVISQSLSSSGRTRVSPGPVIIASPTTRVLTSSSQKRSSSHIPSSYHSTRFGSVSISERRPASNHSGHTAGDLLGTISPVQPLQDPSATSKRTSHAPQTDSHSDESSRPTDGQSTDMGVSEATPVSASMMVIDSPVTRDSSATETEARLAKPSCSSLSAHTPYQLSSETWRVSQKQLITPADKSMSIIAKTPKSGPVRRNIAPRRNKVCVQEEDVHQSLISSASRKAKVRLWAGNGRHRLSSDVTDLDIVLNTVENVIMDYKQKLESSSQRRALIKCFHLMKRELTDKIDLAQEYKVLKSAFVRMTATTRKQRRKLLLLQQENARLNSHIRDLKERTTSKQYKTHEMNEIKSFLSDLQQFHHDGVNSTRGKKGKGHTEFSLHNLGCILTNAQATSSSVSSLKSVNDQLQQWIVTD